MDATVIRPAPVATLTMSSPACTDTFLEDSEVEAGATVPGEQRGHPRLVHADPDPVARHPRLGDLEQGGADAVPVADAHLVVAEPVDGEVLTELAEDEVVALQLLAPVVVRVELIDVHRALLAPVPGAIALAVAVDVQPSDLTRTLRPASFQIPVKTVRPCQLTSRGIPTLTDDQSRDTGLTYEPSPFPARVDASGPHRGRSTPRSIEPCFPRRQQPCQPLIDQAQYSTFRAHSWTGSGAFATESQRHVPRSLTGST